VVEDLPCLAYTRPWVPSSERKEGRKEGRQGEGERKRERGGEREREREREKKGRKEERGGEGIIVMVMGKIKDGAQMVSFPLAHSIYSITYSSQL
jgi:hypothetical protein